MGLNVAERCPRLRAGISAQFCDPNRTHEGDPKVTLPFGAHRKTFEGGLAAVECCEGRTEGNTSAIALKALPSAGPYSRAPHSQLSPLVTVSDRHCQTLQEWRAQHILSQLAQSLTDYSMHSDRYHRSAEMLSTGFNARPTKSLNLFGAQFVCCHSLSGNGWVRSGTQ